MSVDSCPPVSRINSHKCTKNTDFKTPFTDCFYTSFSVCLCHNMLCRPQNLPSDLIVHAGSGENGQLNRRQRKTKLISLAGGQNVAFEVKTLPFNDTLTVCTCRWLLQRRSLIQAWTNNLWWPTCRSSPKPNWSLELRSSPNSTPKRLEHMDQVHTNTEERNISMRIVGNHNKSFMLFSLGWLVGL